jgi:large subunit ribosomal protein L25
VAENELLVEVREHAGKGVARKLRAAGRLPGVVYGRKVGSVAIELDPRALRRLLAKSEAGMNTLINLSMSGSPLDGQPVLLRELQRDPVSGSYVHADLFAVDLEQTVEVSVPIHLSGKARGVEFGGILDQSLRELDLECKPTAIPKEILVDVSELDLGDTVHVRDIALPEGVELRSDAALSVISVVAPAAEEEAPEAAAAAVPVEGEVPAAEPEAKEGEAEPSAD